ncbi:hypothetical protein [Actinoplanes couchii]|uniref:MarR family transcriptional regulator n=1 Tax=Actinoplanes couchii TaxID=403638 RepID=A0ABQ3X174_9ACTN|nr:hypothetical protein [Actinoplanes couchii]MDR6316675.1 hypothetical protein [Actinoplanes couchii]GID52284.1 hypothetical protein Aco03nite_006880 [Actinoplanes couchii]
MIEVKLSVPERALLFILMARNAELSNPQIEKEYAPGLKLTGKNREKLLDAKLIECRKGPRNAYFFTLADGGWRWCRDELRNRKVPAGSGSAGQALYAIFAGLDGFLDRTGQGVPQLFGGLPLTPGADTNPAPATSTRITADEVVKRIRRGYRTVAPSPGAWARLADVRRELGDLDRAEVDGVLRLMVQLPGVRIEEETNQKTLTAEDRAAAVRIGNNEQHLLSIEDR